MFANVFSELPPVEEIQQLLKMTKGPGEFQNEVRRLLGLGIRAEKKHGKAEMGRRIAKATGADLVSVYRWPRGTPPTRTWLKLTGQLAPHLLPSSSRGEIAKTPSSSRNEGQILDDAMILKKIVSQIAALADREKFGPIRAISTLLDAHVEWRGDVDWDLLKKFGIEEMVKLKSRERTKR